MKGLEPLMLGLKPKVLPIKLHSWVFSSLLINPSVVLFKSFRGGVGI